MPYPDMQSGYPAQAWPLHHHVAKARGFSQIFGIHPGIAFLTLIVDLMLFGGDFVTAGALLPVSIGAGAVLGYISYLAQRKWYGDDKETALIKASILGLLTAIPVPLPAVLSLPAGWWGWFTICAKSKVVVLFHPLQEREFRVRPTASGRADEAFPGSADRRA